MRPGPWPSCGRPASASTPGSTGRPPTSTSRARTPSRRTADRWPWPAGGGTRSAGVPLRLVGEDLDVVVDDDQVRGQPGEDADPHPLVGDEDLVGRLAAV